MFNNKIYYFLKIIFIFGAIDVIIYSMLQSYTKRGELVKLTNVFLYRNIL